MAENETLVKRFYDSLRGHGPDRGRGNRGGGLRRRACLHRIHGRPRPRADGRGLGTGTCRPEPDLSWAAGSPNRSLTRSFPRRRRSGVISRRWPSPFWRIITCWANASSTRRCGRPVSNSWISARDSRRRVLVRKTVAAHVRILLVSTLMLPSALRVREVRRLLDEEGVSPKIVVGGAPFRFDPRLWKDVGADAMGAGAAEAVAIVRRLAEEVR